MSRTTTKNHSSKTNGQQVYAVPALEKGLDVLELLSQARQSLGLNEIAEALGRSRHELFRVVTCLSVRGYLLRDAAGDYRLSSKMLEIGSRHVAQQAIITQAMPAMEVLSQITGEASQLLLVGRERLLVIANAAGSAHLQLEVKVGNSIPQYCSVVGLLSLAFSGESGDTASWERRREIQKEGGDVIEPELRDLTAWQERLARIRHDGYITANSPAHAGSRVHTAPILNASGKLVAVISIARLVAVREDNRCNATIDKALLECCRKVSARLGAVEGAAIVDGEPLAVRRSAARRS